MFRNVEDKNSKGSGNLRLLMEGREKVCVYVCACVHVCRSICGQITVYR